MRHRSGRKRSTASDGDDEHLLLLPSTQGGVEPPRPRSRTFVAMETTRLFIRAAKVQPVATA